MEEFNPKPIVIALLAMGFVFLSFIVGNIIYGNRDKYEYYEKSGLKFKGVIYWIGDDVYKGRGYFRARVTESNKSEYRTSEFGKFENIDLKNDTVQFWLYHAKCVKFGDSILFGPHGSVTVKCLHDTIFSYPVGINRCDKFNGRDEW